MPGGEPSLVFFFSFLPAIDTTGFEVVKDQNARSSRSKVDSIPNSVFLCISGMQSGAFECEYLGSDEVCWIYKIARRNLRTWERIH